MERIDQEEAGRFGGSGGVTGVVTEILPSALYRVRLGDGPAVTAHIADRVERNFVRVLVGDRVRLELSPIDTGRGRIVEKL
jgi:translation initiation factor IF-1